MICIGLYEWPLNKSAASYKGLYRGNSLIHLPRSRTWEAFFRVAQDGSSASYTEENLLLLKKMYTIAKTWYPQTDLLLFSDSAVDLQSVPGAWERIGFDVCGDSHYYSPIGAGLRDTILSNGAEAASTPDLHLNETGLFASVEEARIFSLLCNGLQRSGANEIESETNWRPWCVWRYAGE